METLARQIVEELKLVWNGHELVQVLKKNFKEIDPVKAQTKIIKFSTKAMDDYKALQAELYTHYLRLADEFSQEESAYEDLMDFVKKEGYSQGLFEIKANGIIWNKQQKKAIIERLKLKADKYNKSVGSVEINLGMIKDAMTVLIDDIQKEKIDEIRKSIAYDPNVEADWDELLRMMRIQPSEDVDNIDELHINAIKHIIWQVKRKINNLPVKYHLCLILYGKQGCGKSDFLKRIFEPLEDVYTLIDGGNISDKFNAHMFENHFVGNLDELTKINDKSIEEIKQFITTEQITSRKMMTQLQEQTNQNMTLVGSSNRPINKAIHDFSGMRRWWQIDINKGFQTMDFSAIEAEDFIKYWKAVDENEIGFYSTKNEAMVKYQDSFRAISSVEEFTENYGYECDYTGDTVNVLYNAIWEDYKEFCKRFANKLIKSKHFKASLVEQGFKVIAKREGSKNIQYVQLTKYMGDEFE